MLFNETLETTNFANFAIVLQSYTDNNNRDIYNVSIEYNVDNFYTSTLDIYEARNLKLAKKYYQDMIDNIIKTNTIKGE